MNAFRCMISGSMFVSAAALLLAGCATNVGAGDDETDPENVGEVQSAFGEATCGSTAPLDYTDTNTNWSQGHDSGYHSASPPYGSSSCTNALVGQYTNVTSNVRARAEWFDTIPTTQSACVAMRARVYTYDSSGSIIATNTAAGHWTTLDGTYYFCQPPLAEASLYASGSTATPRAVADAYSCSGSPCTETYKAVRVHAVNPI